MKVLILAENLELNRTSSGLRSQKQIFLYEKIFTSIKVITSTKEELVHRINGVDYTFLQPSNSNKLELFNQIPKSIAFQNYFFGLEYLKYKQIKEWKNALLQTLKQNDFDLVVTLSSGASFIPAYAVYFLKGKYNCKHLMFIHDPFPLNQYPPPYQKPNSLPYHSVAKLFGKVIKSADIVSFPSKRLMEWMSTFYPFVEEKFIIQPHIGLHLKELYSLLPTFEKERFPLFPKGINIVHTGSLLGPRNPNYLISGLKKLFKTIPDTRTLFHVHIIGKMNKIWKPENLISENVHLYNNRVAYLESLHIQQNADVLLLLEAVSEVSPFMPGKLSDYLMAKKPILALTPKTSETTRILGVDYPLLAKNGDSEEIYDKLVLIYYAYLNNTLENLVPDQQSIDYVRPENWKKQLEAINTKK